MVIKPFRVIIVFSVLINLGHLAHAQNPTADSIRRLLTKHQESDAERVDLLNALGQQYWVIDPIKSDSLGHAALSLAKKLEYQKGEAFAYRVIGTPQWARGNYDVALKYLIKSLDLYQEIGDRLGEANAIMNIGLVYAAQRADDQALQSYGKAIEIFETLGQNRRIATTYTKIGSVYMAQGAYDEAAHYYQQANTIHQHSGYRYGQAEVLSSLGDLYKEKEQYSLALSTLGESLAISQEINDVHGVAGTLMNIGEIHLRQGQFQSAEDNLNKALETASSIDSKNTLKEIYENLVKLSVDRRQYQAALEYYENFVAMKDSLFNEEVALEITNLRMDQAAARQEQEIAILEQQARVDRLVQLMLIVGVIALLVLSYLIINNQRLKMKKNQQLFEKNRLLANARLENSQLREKELQQELEFKNKELTSYTVNFIRKNELLEELKDEIQSLKVKADPSLQKQLNGLHRMVESNSNFNKDWDDFRLFFENVHHNFFRKLKEKCSDLTTGDLKLCALIKLNLNLKETAAFLGISPESVKTARYRLRKKLCLTPDESLTDFILSVKEDEAVGAEQIMDKT